MELVDFSKIKISCEKCNLSELCLPRGLGREDLEKLDEIAKRTRPLHKGDVLFRNGDEFKALYAVRSGCIKITTSSEAGEEQVLGFYLPGEIVGLDGVDNKKHSCSAVALETSSLCGFPYTNLTDICRRIPALNEQLYSILGRELSYENQLLLTITKKNAEERMATFLISLSTRYQRLGYSSTEFKLSMSRSEIGNYLGMTIETVSRTLSNFQKQDLIKIEHKHIRIKELDTLKTLCHTGSNLNTGNSVA